MGFFSRSPATDDKTNRRNASRSSKSTDRLDPVDDMKRKARRRLIGAVTLLMTAIIVLPMVLDEEPQAVSSGVALLIPSKDAPFAPVKPAAKAAAAALMVAPAAPVISPPAPVSIPTEKKQLPVAQSGEPASATAAANKIAAKPDSKPESKPASKTDIKLEPKPEIKKPPVKDDAPDEIAKIAKAEPKPDNSSRYFVQVGAYGNESKARDVVEKLKAKGLGARVEVITQAAGNSLYRVRLGPYSSKEAAVKAQDQSATIGYQGSLVQ